MGNSWCEYNKNQGSILIKESFEISKLKEIKSQIYNKENENKKKEIKENPIKSEIFNYKKDKNVNADFNNKNDNPSIGINKPMKKSRFFKEK